MNANGVACTDSPAGTACDWRRQASLCFADHLAAASGSWLQNHAFLCLNEREKPAGCCMKPPLCSYAFTTFHGPWQSAHMWQGVCQSCNDIVAVLAEMQAGVLLAQVLQHHRGLLCWRQQPHCRCAYTAEPSVLPANPSHLESPGLPQVSLSTSALQHPSPTPTLLNTG